MPRFNNINGVQIQFTAEEELQKDAEIKAWNDASADRKLNEIKKLRKEKLEATDYMANSDYTMPDNIKTWRQSLRDLPQNNTTEEQYDLLLAQDEQGNLTHTVWSKP